MFTVGCNGIDKVVVFHRFDAAKNMNIVSQTVHSQNILVRIVKQSASSLKRIEDSLAEAFDGYALDRVRIRLVKDAILLSSMKAISRVYGTAVRKGCALVYSLARRVKYVRACWLLDAIDEEGLSTGAFDRPIMGDHLDGRIADARSNHWLCNLGKRVLRL